MTSKNKIIAIIGGMGPASGECLQSLLFTEMRNNLCIQNDQEYIDIIHCSFGSEIPDRTSFLEGKTTLNPAIPVFKIFQQLENISLAFKRPIVGCISCNTFFAPPIFDHFKELWEKKTLHHIQYLNLVEHTTNFTLSQFQSGDKIGLISTTGERKLKIYQKLLEEKGLEILHLDIERQQKLHQAIYDVKSNPFDSHKAHTIILDAISLLLSQGAQKVLLGCTEISLVINQHGFNPLQHIDPLRVIAQELLKEASFPFFGTNVKGFS
ncbi:MAG: aspartate/glutamate racemase family protein [Candidatus Paracaedimonas acanthamoebae]|uniref:Aspartate/glutamate racemase family protein n=1 Tax=Candidatus Paracaedimonas acanthamoebae TaxID=244581 RepID=A0A8J7PXV5_9PROT|nr:aspartate/glutamate racemase family protein [Candidatus Paracaedimonas acanthamoebae]